MKKKLLANLYLRGGRGSKNLNESEELEQDALLALVQAYQNNGIDELLLIDLSSTDDEHEENIDLIKKICRCISIPVMIGGNIRRVEDVKKFLYAGAKKAVLDFSRQENIGLLPDVSARFGKEKLAVFIPDMETLARESGLLQEHASELVFMAVPAFDKVEQVISLPYIIAEPATVVHQLPEYLSHPNTSGVACTFLNEENTDYMELKHKCAEAGVSMNLLESSLPFSEFKINADGLVPVVVQDYKTAEVLMLAYMNEESYNMTIRTGKMTYYSRSRQELWVKGLTSGHFQYVKSLFIDCDKDTILAKVHQIGAACHTGNPTCFFTPLAGTDENQDNPLEVFESVYQTISDRKTNPKEGSYTNYLFDKGVDKILKKLGEEATEIVIAAKNPNPEEIKYEISDFLYHAMVLMVEQGVTWEDITEELARR